MTPLPHYRMTFSTRSVLFLGETSRVIAHHIVGTLGVFDELSQDTPQRKRTDPVKSHKEGDHEDRENVCW